MGRTVAAHTLSPTGVAVVLLLALVIDWMSIGPNSIRDRLAFLLAVPAIREGIDGSPIDQHTVEALRAVIQTALNSTGDTYLAGAAANQVISALVGIGWIYAIGCLLPNKAGKKLGRYATMSWPTTPLHRLNTRLWIMAILLGMLSDLAQGAVGDGAFTLLQLQLHLVAPLPAFLFGAS